MMGTSYYENISSLLEIICIINPSSILDIGCGQGNYGFLSKNFLQSLHTLDGIDIWRPYTEKLEIFYTKIYTGNIKEILSTCGKYDLVLLIDVLEHFNEKDGKNILYEAMKHGINVLISVPKDNGNQKDLDGNPYQEHIYQWKKNDFKLPKSYIISNKRSWIIIQGNNWYKFHPIFKVINSVYNKFKN